MSIWIKNSVVQEEEIQDYFKNLTLNRWQKCDQTCDCHMAIGMAAALWAGVVPSLLKQREQQYRPQGRCLITPCWLICLFISVPSRNRMQNAFRCPTPRSHTEYFYGFGTIYLVTWRPSTLLQGHAPTRGWLWSALQCSCSLGPPSPAPAFVTDARITPGAFAQTQIAAALHSNYLVFLFFFY